MNPANIEIGDLFLAKFAGCPLWPIRISEVMTTNTGDCKFVVFFATAKNTIVSLYHSLIFLVLMIKQFVVTNCSEERPGSIVTKTLKNGILIPIVTSKKSHFNADFKYITFIKISLTYQKLRA